MLKKFSRLLPVLGIALGAVAAQASVSGNPDSLVHVGMSAGQVLYTLGDPSRVVQSRGEAGPTWTYDVVNGASRSLFEVDFDANGKVSWITKRDVQTQ